MGEDLQNFFEIRVMRTIAIEPHASTLPRVTFNQAQVRAEEGSPVQLPCVAQGNPPPTYSDSCACGEVGDPIHYVASCPLTLSWYIRKPSTSLESL
ncbi:hypothetical protein AVEN_187210-1 [Araneus ventricosus]|uniref:Ig-like domain-containing protein n=1 Tax=Araneus ventricosus TaxID=182803 RepID=A0A4Y2Q9H3_ARAVE|nr:hypothetical protein AVEN_36613-1 [Araneus ventricosus]GBN59267.1 hypothetical protein AVEN_187210-1 [Araneus ventricosus]